jgi:hypothetical protein
MEKIALLLNPGFIPEGGERREVLEERLEESPIGSFPNSNGEGGGRSKVEICPDSNMIGEGGGVMDSPI